MNYAIDRDFIREIVSAIRDTRYVPARYEETCVPIIDGHDIEIVLPWRSA